MAKTKQARGTCSLEGCGEPHKAAGYCQTHYMQHRRGVTPYLVIKREMNGPEACTEEGCCEPVKAKGLCHMHYARLLRHGHTMYRDRKKEPKLCNVEGCSDWHYAKGMCHKHYQQVKKVTKTYNITMDEYVNLKQLQRDKCAICGGECEKVHNRSGRKVELHIDHCHDTGKVRGLLCDKCNRGIGLLKDNPELLRAAAAYIERHRFAETAKKE